MPLNLNKRFCIQFNYNCRIFLNPVVRPEKVAELTGLSQVSSYKLIDDFVRLGILREVTGGQRNRIFLFHEYFDVFNDNK